MLSRLPDPLPIVPIEGRPNCAVRLPGSKSLTNRALVLAALAGRDDGSAPVSRLTGALRSEDTEVMVDCLRRMGVRIECDWGDARIEVQGTSGAVPAVEADLFVANSGTTMRFLTAAAALGRGSYRLDGVPRMRERPIGDLVDALRQLGCAIEYEKARGYPPIRVHGSGLAGGRTSIRGDASSQFLSGLLMVAPFARSDVEIRVDGPLVSEPYVAMTIAMQRQFGVDVERPSPGVFRIASGQRYRPQSYAVEPDASAATYFAGAAAILGGRVTLVGLDRNSLQGDIRFLELLEQMGCTLFEGEGGIGVQGGPLRGIEADMNAISDTVMTLAMVACFAEGKTVIRNVAHIRHKETDRLAALATELRRIGMRVQELEDGLVIDPQAPKPAAVDTYNDHRMAMSLALVGLRVPGIAIRNPGCVGKTYPGFFEDLEKLRCA